MSWGPQWQYWHVCPNKCRLGGSHSQLPNKGLLKNRYNKWIFQLNFLAGSIRTHVGTHFKRKPEHEFLLNDLQKTSSCLVLLVCDLITLAERNGDNKNYLCYNQKYTGNGYVMFMLSKIPQIIDQTKLTLEKKNNLYYKTKVQSRTYVVWQWRRRRRK